jgi:hypothetical protein
MANQTATLFHAQNTRDSMFFGDNDIYNSTKAIEAFKTGDYKEVGWFTVLDNSINSLEAVYHASQNIREPWCLPVKRSTSVGDIVQIDNTLWIVASCGFEFLTQI